MLPFSVLNAPTASGDTAWVVDSIADDGSEGTLRYAIDNCEEGDTITFASSVRGTITLDPDLGQLVIDHSLTIEGPGAERLAVSGDGESRVLFIKGPRSAYCDGAAEPSCCEGGAGTGDGCAADDFAMPGHDVQMEMSPDVIVSGLTIRNGFPKYREPYPCIPADPLKEAHGPGCYGGNVLCVRADVSLIDCVIEGGLASQGGGVAVRNDASLLAQGCAIRDNVSGPNDSEVEFYTSVYSGGGLDVRNESAVVLEDCTITGNAAEQGGAITSQGKGSGDDNDVALVRCTISGNHIGPVGGVDVATEPEYYGSCSDPYYGGGGVYAKKTSLLIEDCLIAENTADDGEYMFAAGGGLLLKRTAATILGTTVSGNVAGTGMYGGFGGGIACLNSDMRVDTCIISDNVAGDGSEVGAGGGIYIGQGYLSVPRGTLEPASGGNLFPANIENSLIAGNTAGSSVAALAAGGGIGMGQYEFIEHDLFYFFEPENGDIEPSSLDYNVSTALINCTISGNAAYTADGTSSGGGITNTHNCMTMVLSFCTVTENTSSYAAGLSTLLPMSSELDVVEPGSCQPKIRVKNSIVAGNDSLEGDSEIDAHMMSWSGNVLSMDAGTVNAEPAFDCFDGGCGDVIVTGDPLLGPLADNGGPTRTHALLPGSPAIDAACDCRALFLDFYVPDGPTSAEEGLVETDQCGRPRSVDGDADGEPAPDAGSFEAQPDIVLPDTKGQAVNAGQATVGDCITFRVRVLNQGAAALTIEDILLIGSNSYSVVGDYSDVILDGGESMWLTLRFCPTMAGSDSAELRILSTDLDEPVIEVALTANGVRKTARTLEPADLAASYLLIDPLQVLPGQQVIVSANICNSGGQAGSRTATLTVNGAVEQSQSVTVSPGACQQVAFSFARTVPGTYDVSINGMQGQFTVLAPRTVQSTIASQQATGLGTAGIIAIIAVMITLIAALAVIFKQS